MSARKVIVLIVSFALAYIFGEGLFPTPNALGGGEAKMFVLIFLTVGFKVVIEFFLNRRRKKRADKHVDKTVA
jgi:Flp pilus assembly protein protease CpaA